MPAPARPILSPFAGCVSCNPRMSCLHDALISPELLAEANPRAKVISVGKRGYCIGSTKQETINEALVRRYAREGKSVCRSKCGDPCVFGRGGEEAEVLVEARRVVRNCAGRDLGSRCVRAAGIPLTHR